MWSWGEKGGVAGKWTRRDAICISNVDSLELKSSLKPPKIITRWVNSSKEGNIDIESSLIWSGWGRNMLGRRNILRSRNILERTFGIVIFMCRWWSTLYPFPWGSIEIIIGMVKGLITNTLIWGDGVSPWVSFVNFLKMYDK